MKKWLTLGVLLISLIGVGAAIAQSQTVEAVVIGGGSAVIGDEGLSLDVTIGQAIVGSSSDGSVELTAGFGGNLVALNAGGLSPTTQMYYLPIILTQ